MPSNDIYSEILGLTSSHVSEVSDGIFIHRQMFLQYQRMQQAAKEDGIELFIASGFRDFNRQLLIWNAKFNGLRPILNKQQQSIDLTSLSQWQKIQAILTYSALPGASRHHWGTDIDVFDKSAISSDYQLKLVPSEYEGTGPFVNLSKWLNMHAHKFDFYFPYQSNNAGIAPEPWHLSYAPLSCNYQHTLNNKPRCLFDHLSKTDIAGKDEILQKLDFILNDYIFNISSPNKTN